MLEFIHLDDSEDSDPNNSMDAFKTAHPLNTVQDRFILKTHSSEDKKKFENLIRRKRN